VFEIPDMTVGHDQRQSRIFEKAGEGEKGGWEVIGNVIDYREFLYCGRVVAPHTSFQIESVYMNISVKTREII
jgi:hypothetical protein